SIVHNPRGQQGKNISYIHEFAYMIYPNDQNKYLADIKRDEIDSRNLRDSGTESDRTDAATCFYPILIKDNKVIGFGDVPDDSYHPGNPNITLPDGTIQVWPIDPNGNEKKWRYGRESVPTIKEKLEPKLTSSYQIIFNQDMGTMKSLWHGAQYDASEYGTKVLQSILSVEGAKNFSYPKSLNTVVECTRIALNNKQNSVCLDYFAGSGTTAHAIIKQNRENERLKCKYILCEMGLYFDRVTRMRTERVIYSSDWSDGKPISRNGVSQCFKYIRLEQYEDTLNNLEIKKQQTDWRDDEFHESYILSYMLDTETRDSLLNLKMFVNPFNMSLKTTKDNELVETKVDMVETFNYLIGLNVETEDWFENDNICVVQGKTHRGGLKTLVIWRNCEEIDNEKLCRFFERMDFRTRDTEFDLIYVNGDNTLPNLRRDEENWKVVLTEEEFAKRMFEED
ncbi:MAG: site-specific DNA-methyltransferase, partial [Bacteroidaceae bacterium]|nr:site-specific DNA-methyltransferase [Bacteroidaceae bacterium]